VLMTYQLLMERQVVMACQLLVRYQMVMAFQLAMVYQFVTVQPLAKVFLFVTVSQWMIELELLFLALLDRSNHQLSKLHYVVP
jgi:hypothetical protein